MSPGGMAWSLPPELFYASDCGRGNMAGKKKSEGSEGTPERNGAGNRRRNVQRGGFAVYRVVDMKGVSVNDDRGTAGFQADEALVLAKATDGTFAQGLADTGEALRWIREHAGQFDGVELLIVQEKRRVTPKIEKIEKVIIS